jgi:hypothetical protein
MDSFEMIRFEEEHTKWLRNCKTFEATGISKIAYAVCRIDDEYGHLCLSKVFFTMNDAFEYACKRANSRWKNYCDFLLVENIDEWFDADDFGSRWEYTDIAIYEYIDGSDSEPLHVHLLGKRAE